jgi:hypothetical protein
MDRFLRMLVSGAALVGGLAGVPSLAQAQEVNVAPPAYPVPAPYQAAPYQPAPWQAQPRYRGGNYDSSYGSPGDGYNGRDERRHERWERDLRHHHRDCRWAYQNGAPWWVLERMRCPAY